MQVIDPVRSFDAIFLVIAQKNEWSINKWVCEPRGILSSCGETKPWRMTGASRPALTKIWLPYLCTLQSNHVATSAYRALREKNAADPALK